VTITIDVSSQCAWFDVYEVYQSIYTMRDPTVLSDAGGKPIPFSSPRRRSCDHVCELSQPQGAAALPTRDLLVTPLDAVLSVTARNHAGAARIPGASCAPRRLADNTDGNAGAG